MLVTSKGKAKTTKELIDASIGVLIDALESGHSEVLTAYLSAMAKFHYYSFGNVLLIAMQKPGSERALERGLEYDTLSGRYAEFVETEVLPYVESHYNVKLSRSPDSRATMGCSSGAAAAFSMAWYRSDLYHRVLSYSGTFVNQQWPYNPETPGGAWDYHRALIPNGPAKPLRIWMQVGDRDLLATNRTDGMHDWVMANENMARVLAAKDYAYQFVFARNAGHCDRAVKMQTLPQALEWVWKGHAVDAKLTR